MHGKAKRQGCVGVMKPGTWSEPRGSQGLPLRGTTSCAPEARDPGLGELGKKDRRPAAATPLSAPRRRVGVALSTGISKIQMPEYCPNYSSLIGLAGDPNICILKGIQPAQTQPNLKGLSQREAFVFTG